MTNQNTSRELVKAGHALAKTLGTDSPLLEVAKLISDISTRLDVAVVRGNELQLKLDAVVAENAALKGFVEERCWVYDEDVESYRDAHDYLPETPTDDAILNALRAEGVEMYGNLTISIGQEERNTAIVHAGRQALLFANKLRSGDVDKAGE
ncbi:hypothetical protein PUG81_01380 [Erwiniaceae bacterium L1_54_6]|nr:hypothetical protein [Erwiniaceae bacterium L1_54_6]